MSTFDPLRFGEYFGKASLKACPIILVFPQERTCSWFSWGWGTKTTQAREVALCTLVCVVKTTAASSRWRWTELEPSKLLELPSEILEDKGLDNSQQPGITAPLWPKRPFLTIAAAPGRHYSIQENSPKFSSRNEQRREWRGGEWLILRLKGCSNVFFLSLLSQRTHLVYTPVESLPPVICSERDCFFGPHFQKNFQTCLYLVALNQQYPPCFPRFIIPWT